MSQPKKVFSRRRVCRFCTDKDIVIDYKDALKIYRQENLHYGYCLCFEGLGMLAIGQKHISKGARLFGAREKSRTWFVEDYLPFMVREREAHMAIARAQLGEEAFQRAWEEGKAISIEEAIQYAMDETDEN